MLGPDQCTVGHLRGQRVHYIFHVSGLGLGLGLVNLLILLQTANC